MSVAEKVKIEKKEIIQPKKMGLLVENPVYKPFRYPWCYDAWLTQQRIHWLPEEVPLGDDVRDWQKNLSQSEKNLLTQIFRFFTQADVEVSNCYLRHYTTVFKPTEVLMMMTAFASMETVHIAAYSHLLDTIGMPESEYSAFMKYKEMKDKYDYMQDFNVNSKEDIGFGFDGDGDRVGVIDENGNEIFSDKIGLLIARNLSTSYSNSKFVVDVKSTGLYKNDKILNENQCETIYWKTGHSHIKRKVHDEKALAGFEKSGHFFFNQPLGHGYDDGINSAIQICHLLDNKGKSISKIVKDLPKTYQSPTMAPFCKDGEKYKLVEDLTSQIEKIRKDKIKIDGQIIKDILTVNGIRFSFEDESWGLIRASSNKPSLVVVTESPKSELRMKKIFEFIDNLLTKTGKIGSYDQKI